MREVYDMREVNFMWGLLYRDVNDGREVTCVFPILLFLLAFR